MLLAVLSALGGCARTTPPSPAGDGSPAEPVVYDNVRVLGNEARAALTAFSLDLDSERGDGELRFRRGAAELEQYAPADVLVSEPVPGVAPHGFLQIIESSREEGTEIVFRTVQANLLDVFEEADIVFEQELTEADLEGATLHYEGMSLNTVQPGDLQSQASGSVGYGFEVEFSEVLVDADGNPATEDDQLRLDGSFRFSASASAGIDICAVCGSFFTPAVRKVYGKVRLEEEISVAMAGELATGFSESVRDRKSVV